MGQMLHMIQPDDDEEATKMMELLLDEAPPTSLVAAIEHRSDGGQPPLAIDVSYAMGQTLAAITPIHAGVSNLEELMRSASTNVGTTSTSRIPRLFSKPLATCLQQVCIKAPKQALLR